MVWKSSGGPSGQSREIFAVALIGSTAFGLLTVASALVTGRIVGQVVVPAFGRAPSGAIGTGPRCGCPRRDLTAQGVRDLRPAARRRRMQFRLQATYRRKVTRRYLELPLSWHRRHATGTLLSNANSDVEALWFPIAPMPFAVGTMLMLVAAIVSLFAIDWTFALVGLADLPVAVRDQRRVLAR